MPAVSVIMAAYNAEDYIERAVRSALDQLDVDLEVVVCDDGSSDDTARILNRIASGDPRVCVLRSQACSGPSAARNKALDACRGEWVAILDSDDAMQPNRLHGMIIEAENLGCDVLADNLQLIDFYTDSSIGLAFSRAWMADDSIATLRTLMQRDWPGRNPGMGIGFMKPIVRRSFLVCKGLRYDEDVWTGEDILLYVRLVDAGAKMRFQENAGYIYSVRSASTKSQARATKDLVEVNRQISALKTAKDSGLDFHERAQAIWYQDFSTSLKSRRISAAFTAARQLRVGYVATQFVRAAGRRLRGTPSRWSHGERDC